MVNPVTIIKFVLSTALLVFSVALVLSSIFTSQTGK